jgi:hypothetical protein
MEQKDIWIIILGALGWSWGIIQFFINRRNQKNDKALEKRFEIYTAYMKKSDELMEQMRTDPNIVYGITTEFMSEILGGEQGQINDALLNFNTKLLEFTKRATQPLMILNQELNNLYLVCSNEFLPKIQEYKKLANDYNSEYQSTLQTISPKDGQDMINKLSLIGHDNRWIRLTELNTEIFSLMRNEIGYYNRS